MSHLPFARALAAGGLLAATLNASAAIDVPSGAYVLEKSHAYITFSYSHLGFSTPHVGFTDFDVSLDFDAESPENSKLEVSVDPNSVDSRVAEFDEHLVGERFFHTAEHPEISFVSTAVEMTGENTAKVTGDLTMKGQTHPVTLDVTLNKAAQHPMLQKPVLGFNAEGKVSRSQWDMGYAVPAVGDEVDLYITVELLPAE